MDIELHPMGHNQIELAGCEVGHREQRGVDRLGSAPHSRGVVPGCGDLRLRRRPRASDGAILLAPLPAGLGA